MHNCNLNEAMARRLPPLNPLKVFEVAARYCSFVRAAEELNITQSAVSRQVRTLEEYLQVPLFRRGHRALELTESARRYLPALTQAFDTIDHATGRIFDVKDKNRLFLKASLRTLFMSWLLPRFSSFRSRYPEFELNLSTSVTISGDDFYKEPIDVALSREHPNVEGLRCEAFMEELLIPVCSPSFLMASGQLKHANDMKGLTLLHNRTRSGCWRTWLEATDATDVDPEAGVTLDGFFITVQAAITGMGIAMVPRPIAEDWLLSGQLIQPFDLAVPSGDRYYLLYQEHRAKVPKIGAFRSWLFDEAKSVNRSSTSESPDTVTIDTG